MKLKNFKERIQTTVIWVGSLTFLFLAIGILVVSDISIDANYDSAKAYNLFKDSIGFGATILTPIIAVVFFSDWREQHIAKELESKSQNIYEHAQNLTWNLFHHESDIGDEINLSLEKIPYIQLKQLALSDDITKLNFLIDDMDLSNSTTNEFIECAKNVKNEIREGWFYLEKIYSVLLKIHNPSEYNYEYVGETNEDFIKHNEAQYASLNQEWVGVYCKIHTLLKKLKPIKDSLKIKI